MLIFNNIRSIVKNDLEQIITTGRRVSTAAIFSYVYQELRFIIISQAFITEQAPKEHREFYIPRLNRKRSLYRLEYEIKPSNELSQKAIAKEYVGWIRLRLMNSSGCLTPYGTILSDRRLWCPTGSKQAVSLGRPLLIRINRENCQIRLILCKERQTWDDNSITALN